MRYLTNADVAGLIDARAAIDAMQAGYDDYRRGVAEQIPRADLISHTGNGDAVHRFGMMAGSSRALDLAVVRIKSDVVSWSPSGREDKFAGRPGLFAGIVLAFRISDGAPVAILQDGLLQHVRVGAAAAIATGMLAPADTPDVALLGSGGMAESILESMVHVRAIRRVRVFSPDAGRRSAFAARMAERLGLDIVAVDTPRAAVEGAQLVLSATNSTRPPFEAARVSGGAHVTVVTRREMGADLLARADLVACLGPGGYPPEGVPRMHLTRGGYGAFLALTADERRIQSPYSDETVYAVPPLNPDVTVIHAQRADANGNTQIWGLLGCQKEAAFAAERVIVVVEELVDEAVIRADPNRTVIPGLIVDAVVVEPYGAHPSYVQGAYDRDNRFYLDWDPISRDEDALQAWLRDWVYDLPDRAAYVDRMGEARWAGLQPGSAPSGSVDYGDYR